jgi:hypothetical protein
MGVTAARSTCRPHRCSRLEPRGPWSVTAQLQAHQGRRRLVVQAAAADRLQVCRSGQAHRAKLGAVHVCAQPAARQGSHWPGSVPLRLCRRQQRPVRSCAARHVSAAAEVALTVLCMWCVATLAKPLPACSVRARAAGVCHHRGHALVQSRRPGRRDGRAAGGAGGQVGGGVAHNADESKGVRARAAHSSTAQQQAAHGRARTMCLAAPQLLLCRRHARTSLPAD